MALAQHTVPEKDAKLLTQNPDELPAEISAIFDTLTHNDSIVFKSQKIDEEELQREDKMLIVKELYQRNRAMFLLRFGAHLTASQITDFRRVESSEQSAELELLLNNYEQALQSRQTLVKNRRYAALQALIKAGEYFEEHALMTRAPALYEEFIGQYLTEPEKKARDCYDVGATPLSGIMLSVLEQQQREEQLQAVSKREEPKSATEKILQAVHRAVDETVPTVCRQQWGGFEDEPSVACTSTKLSLQRNREPHRQAISTGERQLLRQEFIDLMQQRFLAGEEQDFDYATVDNDAQLDNLQQISQDLEDKYFEQDDDETATDPVEQDKDEGVNDDSEDDELDIYMRHLHKLIGLHAQ